MQSTPSICNQREAHMSEKKCVLPQGNCEGCQCSSHEKTKNLYRTFQHVETWQSSEQCSMGVRLLQASHLDWECQQEACFPARGGGVWTCSETVPLLMSQGVSRARQVTVSHSLGPHPNPSVSILNYVILSCRPPVSCLALLSFSFLIYKMGTNNSTFLRMLRWLNKKCLWNNQTVPDTW